MLRDADVDIKGFAGTDHSYSSFFPTPVVKAGLGTSNLQASSAKSALEHGDQIRRRASYRKQMALICDISPRAAKYRQQQQFCL